MVHWHSVLGFYGASEDVCLDHLSDGTIYSKHCMEMAYHLCEYVHDFLMHRSGENA